MEGCLVRCDRLDGGRAILAGGAPGSNRFERRTVSHLTPKWERTRAAQVVKPVGGLKRVPEVKIPLTDVPKAWGDDAFHRYN